MKKLTIMIIAYNQEASVKLSVESIRMFADVPEVSVVVIDNGSADGLQQWANDQQDITYVYMDEGKEPYGRLLNRVKEALDPEGDILLMQGNFLLTPACLSRMQSMLCADEAIGAAGPMSNAFYYSDQEVIGLQDYEAAVQWSVQQDDIAGKRVLGLYYGAILFRAEAMRQIGEFDEQLMGSEAVMKDYCLRIILGNWSLQVCQTAMLWCIVCNPYEDKSDGKDDILLEQKWGMHYFNAMHNSNLIDMIQHPEDEDINVLEVGCDCGATLLEVTNRFPRAHVYGSELNPAAAQVASHVATVTVNNIEEQNLEYEGILFDYIFFGDVLEHLRNPLAAILYCKKLLKQDGHIIASIPNLMHISVLEQLLKQGDFTYTEMGLLDKTHIHLFTFHEIGRMFQKAGFGIEKTESVVLPPTNSQHALIDQLLRMGENTERHMYETYQYVISAKVL